MSTLTSIPVSNPKRFLALQDHYKHALMGDQRLEEAAKVAARRQLLLENKKVDPHWAVPQVKAMSRQLNRLTKRIRQPYGAVAPTEEEEEDDPADDFAAGPVQAMVKRFLKPSKPASTIKKTPPNPPVRRPRVQHTPVVTPSPRRTPPPGTPLTGFQLLGKKDYTETPAERRERLWDEFGILLSPVTSNRGASPQWTLGTPPPVRRSPLPSPGVTHPWPSQRLTAPPPDYPYVFGGPKKKPVLAEPTFNYPEVAQRAYDQDQAPITVKTRRKRKRIPSAVRQRVKRLSTTPIARRTRKAVQKKAKAAAADEGTKYLKSWLKFK